jgi:YHS domain-containing protein/uncharacterized membrane protein
VSGPSDISLFLGRLHPLLVHLPIGLILLLVLLEMVGRRPRFKNAYASVGFILALTVPEALVTVICGWLLSQAGGYQSQLLQWHKWTGIGTVAACALAGLLYSLELKKLYRWSLVLTLAALVVASHFGGSLTHGSNYLVRYAPKSLQAMLGIHTPPAVAKRSPEQIAQMQAFADVVQPFLQDNCISCHGPEKSESGLRLDSLSAVLKGGKSGSTLTPGKSSESLLMTRLRLPLNSKEHMPPEGKPQPTPSDLALLRWWIDAGAPEDKQIAELKPPASVEHILAARFGASETASAGVAPKPLSQIQPVIAKLSDELGVALTTMGQNDAWVQCNASIAGPSFGDTQLARLASLGPNLRWLDLGGTKVTDAGLTNLSAMPNLTRLHLERTQVTDSGLGRLSGLTELEYLNLYATAVSDSGLTVLQGLPKLKQIYLWQTKVTPGAAQALAEAHTDHDQIQEWQDQIEQLQARIRGQQVSVDIGEPLAASPVKSGEPINALCPVSAKPVDPTKTVTYEGSLVAFCCKDCKASFEKDPKPYLLRLSLPAKIAAVAADSKPVNTQCPVSGKDIDPAKTVVVEGKVIAFCCDDCKAQFQKDPNPILAKLGLTAAAAGGK